MTRDYHGSFIGSMRTKKEIVESITRIAYNMGYAKRYSLRSLVLRLRLRWLFRHEAAKVYLPLDQNEVEFCYRKRWGSYICSVQVTIVPQEYRTNRAIVLKQESHYKLLATEDKRDFKIWWYIRFRRGRNYVRSMGYKGKLKFRRDEILTSKACAIILKKVNADSAERWYDLRIKPIIVLRSGKVYEFTERREAEMPTLVDDAKKIFLGLTSVDLPDNEEAVEAALVMALMS